MSTVAQHLIVALCAVSLGACYTHATPQSHLPTPDPSRVVTRRPKQVATPRPENVRIQLGTRSAASDTLGRDNPDAQLVQALIVGLMKLPSLGVLGLYAEAQLVSARTETKPPFATPRYPSSELCEGCPVLAMKGS
jgi:hypothetical protein